MENNTGLTTQEIIAIITSVGTLFQILLLAYQAWRKGKPEIKKLDAEGDSEVVDAAYHTLEGAKLGTEMLKERLEELRHDLDAEKKARRDDADYFRRRIKEIEREAKDYRSWAARLAKQVIEMGKEPSPFISSMNDSDPLISAINKEQEQLESAKNKREEKVNLIKREEGKKIE